jgi:hypothetical protein
MECWVLTLLEFLIFFIRNFGKKRPISDRCKKNLSIILDKLILSIVTGPCTF